MLFNKNIENFGITTITQNIVRLGCLDHSHMMETNEFLTIANITEIKKSQNKKNYEKHTIKLIM